MELNPMYLTAFIIVGAIVFLVLFFHYVPFFLWLSAKVSGVNISLVQLFLMRIRNVPPYVIVPGLIEAHKAGLNNITRDGLEAHYLAGGHVEKVVHALVSAAKANIELSVSLTAISTALAVFTTPFNFWLYGNLYLRFADIASEVPHLSIPLWDVFKTIVILLGIPLVLGVMTSHYLPRVAQKLKKPLQWFSILFFIAMVVLSFMGNLDAFLKCIKYIFLVVLLHNLLALAIGWCVGSACRVPRRDRRTLTIETGIQNSGLGLVLLLGTSIFADFPPHGGTLVITAWWGVWHIVSGLAVSTMFYLSDRRQSQKR